MAKLSEKVGMISINTSGYSGIQKTVSGALESYRSDVLQVIDEDEAKDILQIMIDYPDKILKMLQEKDYGNLQLFIKWWLNDK